MGTFKFKLGQSRVASTRLVLTWYMIARSVDSSSSLCPSVDTPVDSSPQSTPGPQSTAPPASPPPSTP
eukprot:3395053-Rhodomonas_salina.1